jgi:ABC-type uncharacterized transport system substrate-binding protein
MRRIGLAVVLAFSLFLAPLAAEGQQPAKIPRVGFLSPGSSSDPRNALTLGALRQGLRELGYVEGQNIAIESRWAEGRYDRLSGLAAELVRLKVDVIATYTAPAIQATKQATATIPIVMGGVIDPVAPGFVTSLARPGGNITGLSIMAPEMVDKQLEILKEAVPKITRVAVLGNPANPGTAPQLRHAQDAARALKLQLQSIAVLGPSDIDTAFAAMIKERADAVLVLVDAMFEEHRTRITDIAVSRRLPSVYGLKNFVEAGGLLYYGAHEAERFRRAAIFIDKILKGAKPGDLPVEQPTKFELVINMKTAKALGLTIPQTLLQRADQVIQ